MGTFVKEGFHFFRSFWYNRFCRGNYD